MARTVFMVSEKPSLAQAISKILSNGTMEFRKGFNGACSIFEWNGKFRGESVFYRMTSVCGHVMTLDFIGKYNNWDTVDPAELFGATAEKKEASPKLRMVNFLQKEAIGADFLVLWLDCDKEGENICFEVIDAVGHLLPRPSKNEQRILRAKFSAITDKDIKSAMNNLALPNENEALSVDARQELDLRIGCAFTRFQTRLFHGKYGNLDSSLISYGPCQTPTLGFCVERHDEIMSFKPETYWVLQVKVTHPSRKVLHLDWDRVRLFDKEIAQIFMNDVKKATSARITGVQRKEKVKPRPIALNTVEMLRVASSSLGIGPQHTMSVAERLYIQGYISYPRTETTHYPESFDLKSVVSLCASNAAYRGAAAAILQEGIHPPKKGHDAGDHPPITPMRSCQPGELSGDDWRLYDYIVQHFLATVSSDCVYLQTTVHFEAGSELFTCVGKQPISPGFTSIMTWQAVESNETFPDMVIGDSCTIEECKLAEKQTGPPDFLTESELISLMEKHGIGTDASIPVHINNICERNYVTIITGRKLKPMPLGIVLVHGYQQIDPDLVLPTMRSAVEKQLNLIALGTADQPSVLQHALNIFEQKFRYFVTNICRMDQLFELTFTPLAETGKPLSKCGKCKHYMKYVQAKPSRLYCTSCDETYGLPQNGSIKLYKEHKCPLDDFELVLWTTGQFGKCYPLCPYCYNNPPFRDMHRGAGCNECLHPSCQFSLARTGIAVCIECDGGVLVLDQTSAPKWRMCCNKCNVVVEFQEDAHIYKISVSIDNCEACGAKVLDVIFNKDKTPLPGGATEHSGCIHCDPVLKPYVGLHYARMSKSGRGRSSRGRGRGRVRRH